MSIIVSVFKGTTGSLKNLPLTSGKGLNSVSRGLLILYLHDNSENVMKIYWLLFLYIDTEFTPTPEVEGGRRCELLRLAPTPEVEGAQPGA